jgi:EAL domain-containing protein (putative c-di-GMP-specific phosphodiesterase class I)
LRIAAHVKEATVSRSGPQDASHGEPIVPAGAARSTPSGPNIAAKLDAADILASVGAALYYLDIESDALVWSSNVLDVLRVTDIAAISTSRHYTQLLDAGNVQARFDAVMQTDQRDEGRGVFFQTEYCIRLDSGSGAKLWIEDSGRWFAGPSGRPEIVAALNERRIFLAYETVVASITRLLAFYECLMRVRRTDGTLLGASDVVPIAERLGLVRFLDHRVLELVVSELAAAPALQASVNVSPASTTDPDWWAELDSLLRAHAGVSERLIVEITESAAIHDVDETRGFVARVKDLGCRIAIDDFGAGYTSFRNLRKLGVDIVKIDGAFVENLIRSED